MKLQLSHLARLGLLLFAIGLLIGLSLSAGILWGEIEVRIDAPYPSSTRLQMECPLMLSPAESGKIETVIVNSTVEDIKPVVLADINRGGSPATAQTIVLAPMETKTIEWTIDGSNVIFDRLILVNVFQSPYSDNPPRLGSCGILSFSLLGLTGMQTFSLLLAGGLVGILLGGGLWLYVCWRLNNWPGLTQAGILIGVMTTLALLSSIVHWWGLTLLLDALIVLLGGILITEFLLFPRSGKS